MSMNASSRVCLGSKSAVATRPRVRVSARVSTPREECSGGGGLAEGVCTALFKRKPLPRATLRPLVILSLSLSLSSERPATDAPREFLPNDARAPSSQSLAPRARIAANKMIRCDWLSEHLNSGGFIGSRENIVSCPFSSPLLSVLLIILGFCATVTLTHESLFFFSLCPVSLTRPRPSQAVCTGTFIMLFAVRNGWAPSTSKNAKLEKGLNLEDSGSDMLSGDPLGKCDEARRNLRCPLERWGRPPERMVGSVPASDAGSGPRFDGWESWED